MKTIIISMISVGSMLFVIMTQSSVNRELRKRQTLENAMSAAMYRTMSEVMEKDSYGIRDTNQMVAAFLQTMMQRMDTDMNLTVTIHEADYERGKLDVEATGTYELPIRGNKSFTIRRSIPFD